MIKLYLLLVRSSVQALREKKNYDSQLYFEAAKILDKLMHGCWICRSSA